MILHPKVDFFNDVLRIWVDYPLEEVSFCDIKKVVEIVEKDNLNPLDKSIVLPIIREHTDYNRTGYMVTMTKWKKYQRPIKSGAGWITEYMVDEMKFFDKEKFEEYFEVR